MASVWLIPPVALLLAGAVVAWVGYDEYRTAIEQEYRFLDAHARIAQDRITERVHHAGHALARVVREAPRYLSGEGGDDAAWLAEMRGHTSDVDALMIVGPAGRVELASDPKFVGFDDSHHEYFRFHRDAANASSLHVSLPFNTPYGDRSIAYSLPIRDDAGKMLGIAVALTHYRRFDDAMTETRPPEDSAAVAILNDGGEFLYRFPDRGSRVGRNVSAHPVFRAHIESGKLATRGIATSPVDGSERMYVLRGIADSPLNVAMAIPLADVLAPWRRDLAVRTAIFLLGAALILRLTWTAYRRQQEVLAGKQFTDRLMETANAMMVVVDSDSRVVAINEATEEITGYPREELVGRSFFDTVMPRGRFPQAWKAFLRYRDGQPLPRAFEAPILTRGGEERVIAWQNNGVFNHRGNAALLSFGVDVTERAQLQQARAREAVSRGLVGIQEEERRQLAMELHDRTSPNLTVLDLKLKILADALPKDASGELADLIEDISATLEDTIASIRSVSLDFRPPLLDYAGLWPALIAYARQLGKRAGIAVEIAGPEVPLRLLPEVETNLFHIAQEALANCARHSHAGSVLIRQTCHGNDLILMICDDGAGFDPAAPHRGSGLANMRQRAAFIGGKLYIDSHPGKGTCIAIRFPVYSPAARCDGVPASQDAAPSPAALPLAKQAVNR